MISVILAVFIITAAIAEITIVPAVLADIRVGVYACIWWPVFLAAVIFAVIFYRKRLVAGIKKFGADIKAFVVNRHCGGFYGILAILLIVLQVFGSLYLTHYDDDDATYLTMIQSNAATDRFMRVYSQTGEEAPLTIMTEYVTTGWYSFLSVIVRTFRIHPLILTNMVLPPLMILLAYGIYIIFARQVFKTESQRCLFLVFCSLINILNNVSSHTSSSVLLMRMHQGKAIFANIVVPAMVCLFLKLWEENERWQPYLMLMALNTAATFFTTSGLVYGAMISVLYGLVLCIKNKRLNILLRTIISVIPSGMLGLVYVLERTREIWL